MNLKKLIMWLIGALVIATFIIINNRKDDTMNTTENKVYTEISAQHILVDTEKQAEEIFKDIKEEKISFEEAAKKYSKCPSGKEGGNLGYFKKGMMVKEFEDAAFGAETGEITKPIKTQFGWHLIKVTDKR